MIFIPSSGGKSHRVDETSDPAAIERGANVLLRTPADAGRLDGGVQRDARRACGARERAVPSLT